MTALVGGEPLPQTLARQLRAAVGRLLNVYGPTETTIWSTAWEVPADPRDASLIGAPIAEHQVHVLRRPRPARPGRRRSASCSSAAPASPAATSAAPT